MIEAKLCFLQMQVERLAWHAIELRKTSFGIAPKALDSIDMNRATSELVGSVIHSQVFIKAYVNQSVIATPAVSVYNASYISLASNNGLERGFGSIWDDFCVDTVASLEQTKDDRFAACTAPTQASHPPGTKVRLIGFQLTAKWRACLAVLSHTSAHA